MRRKKEMKAVEGDVESGNSCGRILKLLIWAMREWVVSYYFRNSRKPPSYVHVRNAFIYSVRLTIFL